MRKVDVSTLVKTGGSGEGRGEVGTVYCSSVPTT